MTKSSVRTIEKLKMAYNLIDSWCIHHPDKKSFSWTQKKPFIRLQLDSWLTGRANQDDVSKTEIIPAIKSDHGPSYWQHNSSLLEDPSYSVCGAYHLKMT